MQRNVVMASLGRGFGQAGAEGALTFHVSKDVGTLRSLRWPSSK